MENTSEYFLYYLLGLKIFFYLTAFFIFISSIDDLFIDICYYTRRLWRKYYIYTKHPRLTQSDLFIDSEQHFALMIPAWQESSVIEKMLLNSIKTYQYNSYVIFIGCYPNDLRTSNLVKKIAENFSKIQLSICPHDGPTNKADCLNSIFQNILKYEKENQCKFDGFILHDAEDIVHPLELKLYNYLIPQKDMIQLPVIPLERSLYNLTAGHYQDEFAENHGKDLVVREFLTNHVSCAGVGCILSRKAIFALRSSNKNPFNSNSLTEDYHMALRLNNLKMKMAFVRMNFEEDTQKTSIIKLKKENIIGTREYFPNRFTDAVKQKSRWIIGIVFQGWQSQKWQGSLALKYMLLRDRKSILTAFFSVAAYFLLFNYFIFYALPLIFKDFPTPPPLIRENEFLIYILWGNLFFLMNRIINRFIYCYSLYGVASALMVVPRLFWGNIINFFASARAVKFFISHLLTGKALVWEKTEHVFPDIQDLEPHQNHIGEILISKGIINSIQLQKNLETQKKLTYYLPIGDILKRSELITEKQLNEALKIQKTMSKNNE